MKSIAELLKLEQAGKPLTSKEKAYLNKYRDMKVMRHATSFIYHNRRIPKENRGTN